MNLPCQLKEKLSVLDELGESNTQDVDALRTRLDILREVAMILVQEFETLDYAQTPSLGGDAGLAAKVRTFEMHLIQSALKKTRGHQTNAASLLGVKLSTLHEKIKRFGIAV